MEEKFFVAASVLYGFGFLSLLWKGVQNECALPNYFHSFSAAELNNIESENDVFAPEFLYKESDYGDTNDEDI